MEEKDLSEIRQTWNKVETTSKKVIFFPFSNGVCTYLKILDWFARRYFGW